MKTGLFLSVTMGVVLGAIPAAFGTNLTVENLKCEYLVNPLGIDVVRPRLSWTLRSDQRGQKQTAYRVLVASSEEVLAQGHGDLWDSGKVDSGRSIQIEYDGKPLPSEQRCVWKVRVWDKDGRGSDFSRPARWSMGLLREKDWKAKWIAAPKMVEGSRIRLPLLRKVFEIERPVRSAMLTITSLGYHDLYLNGRRIGDHVLDPVQSDYGKRVYYVTHDVTEAIISGRNALGVALGKGWYWQGIKGVTLDRPALLAQLVLTHEDGSRTCVATDASWKTAGGPVTIPATCTNAGANFGNEWYDARREQPGWNEAPFDDTTWQAVEMVTVRPLARSAQMIPPNRVTATFPPVSVTECGAGEYLFDLGTNLTGWFRLNLQGNAGDEIRLTYFASHQGQADALRENFLQSDRYICKGDGPETFGSQFNYRGFRFVKVSGLKSKPRLEDAVGLLINTDLPTAGTFACSDATLNRLHEIVTHTHRCLTLGGIQVDCPHRERLGYGAEGLASSIQGRYDFDAAAFYAKWARDFQDGQDRVSGIVYYTAPFRIHSGGGPAWPSVCIVFPWQNYLFHGDRRVLAEHYESMRRWLAFLESKSDQGLLQPHGIRSEKPGTWEFLGDWASPRRKEDTLPCNGHWPTAEENRRFNAFNHYEQVSLVARIANVLGKEDDANRYAAKAEAIRQAIHRTYFDAQKGRYSSGEQQQTILATALQMGLVPAEHRRKVLDNLVDDIVSTRRGHLDFGVLGGYYTIGALTKENRSDLIYRMATQPTRPGWGNLQREGATTLWEHWLPGDSSIHNSFLSIGGWFYEGLSGIRPDPAAPGFKHFVIAPAVVEGLTWVKASHDSPHGRIISSWRREKDRFLLDVTVPANTTASVHLPAISLDTVTESGLPVDQAQGVERAAVQDATVIVEVASGSYRFAAQSSTVSCMKRTYDRKTAPWVLE